MDVSDSTEGSFVKLESDDIDRPMSNPRQIQQNGAARRLTFLDLPPEIRNKIYEYSILVSPVEIVSKPLRAAQPFGKPDLEPPKGNPRRMSFAQYWQTMVVDESPNLHRSTWTVEPMEIYRKFIINPLGNPDIGVTIANKLPLLGGFRAFEASYVKRSNTQSLGVNMFLVNKQICQEASTLFFEKNHFVFNTRWEDVHFAPMAFLWDHPCAYHWVRSLHINIPDPPGFVNHGRIPRGAHALPSNGMWKVLIAQIGKLRLRHFGLTISVDVTDRFHRGLPPNHPFSAAYTYRWFTDLLTINGLQSMELQFDVNFQYVNPFMEFVSADAPSDIPALMSLAQELKDYWLSGKGSYQDAKVYLVNNPRHLGATGARLMFVSWVKADNPDEWDFNQDQLPPLLFEQHPDQYFSYDITQKYRQQHYTRHGIERLLGLSHNEANAILLRHPTPNYYLDSLDL